MPDLISREALKQFPIRRDHYGKENGDEKFISGIESVLEYAEQLPAVDAVLVVRCKDCKHFREARTKRYKQLIRMCCRMGRHDMEFRVNADDFCSYGERRDDT